MRNTSASTDSECESVLDQRPPHLSCRGNNFSCGFRCFIIHFAAVARAVTAAGTQAGEYPAGNRDALPAQVAVTGGQPRRQLCRT